MSRACTVEFTPSPTKNNGSVYSHSQYLLLDPCSRSRFLKLSMAIPDLLAIAQPNLPNKQHPWRSYYVCLGAATRGILGKTLGTKRLHQHQSFSRNKDRPMSTSLPLSPSAPPPPIYSRTTADTKSPISSSPFSWGWNLAETLRNSTSQYASKPFIIIVLSMFSFSTSTRGTDGTLNLRWRDNSTPYLISCT